MDIKPWFVVSTILVLATGVVIWVKIKNKEAHTENFNKQLGTYILDLNKTNLNGYLKDTATLENLRITFSADSSFHLNMQVPFIYDSSGRWEALGKGLEDWNVLYYNSNTEISTQFTQPWTKDSIFYLNSTTPKRGEQFIQEIYFKKIHFSATGRRELSGAMVDSTVPKVGEKLSYSTSVMGVNDYALQVKTTYLYDTTYIFYGWPTEQNKVVQAQEMVFKHKDSVLRIRPFHVRNRSFIRFNKKTVLLDNVIFEAAVIAGTKGSFYKIRGYGGCGDCSSYIGYYSLKGELLFENYFSDGDGFLRNIGNYKSVWSRFGVQASRAKTPDIKEINVFPPAHSGETDQGYIF